MKSASILRSVLLLVPTLLIVGCSGAEGSDEADFGEVSLAQRISPTQGGSCTITTCAGTKDPFGKYSCDKHGNCSCVRGGTTSTCDANGTCKENGCPSPPPATAPHAGGLSADPAADTVQDTGPTRFRYDYAASEVAP